MCDLLLFKHALYQGVTLLQPHQLEGHVWPPGMSETIHEERVCVGVCPQALLLLHHTQPGVMSSYTAAGGITWSY